MILTNKSGDIGTRTATWTCNAWRRHGFPHAERRDETQPDQGDIAGMIGIATQVKGGHAAEDASLEQIRKWLDAAEKQRQAAKADLGLLVCKRKGVGFANADQWWTFFTEATYRKIIGHEKPGNDRIIMRVTLADAAWLLRLGGWGEPLPDVDATADPGGYTMDVLAEPA
jgi:hypothetical protein